MEPKRPYTDIIYGSETAARSQADDSAADHLPPFTLLLLLFSVSNVSLFCYFFMPRVWIFRRTIQNWISAALTRR